MGGNWIMLTSHALRWSRESSRLKALGLRPRVRVTRPNSLSVRQNASRSAPAQSLVPPCPASCACLQEAWSGPTFSHLTGAGSPLGYCDRRDRVDLIDVVEVL